MKKGKENKEDRKKENKEDRGKEKYMGEKNKDIK